MGSHFVVTWTNIADSKVEIYGQRFTFLGAEVGEKVLVSDGSYSIMYGHSEVVMDAVGNTVVVWQNSSNGSIGQNVYARRFNSANVAISEQIVVNTTEKSTQNSPVVSMNDIGQFVVAWQSVESNQSDIYFQCFDSDMTRIGTTGCATSSQEKYSTLTDYSDYVDYWQVMPTVALQRDSVNGTSFRIGWTSFGQEYGWGKDDPNRSDPDKSYGVFSIRYDSMLEQTPTTTVEMRANGYTPGIEESIKTAMDAYGNSVLVWVGPEAADGESTGTTTDIFYRVYTTGEQVPNYVSPLDRSKGLQRTATTTLRKNYSLLNNGGASVATKQTEMTINGTEETANAFVFSAAEGISIDLNGVPVALSAATTSVVYNAAANDTVVITGAGNEEVTVDGSSVTVKGEKYTLTINGGANVTFNGTGVGTAALTAGEGDLFTANGTALTLVSAGRTVSIDGCNDVFASATSGAIAYLIGTSALETLTSGDGVTILASTGYAVAVRGFDEIYAMGAEGDSFIVNDAKARLFATEDSYTVTVGTTALKAEGFATPKINASGITVTVDGQSLTLTGTGDVTASASSVTFGGYQFYGFTDVTINGEGGTAKLLDTAGCDTLVIDASNVAALSGDGYRILAKGFDAINALSVGGKDTPILWR